jgi:aldehyde dehydrogenase (NAD+)
MLIGGKLTEALSGARFDNVNPASEAILGSVADAGPEDMSDAIDAARRAFDETEWSTNRSLRRTCLLQLHEALQGDREAFREELIAEVGCPRALTYGSQLEEPLSHAIRWPAEHIDDFAWITPMTDGCSRDGQPMAREIWKEPVGVVGAITPWNFPLEVVLSKVGQALGAGNTMVLKPAPDTPFNATRLGRLVAEQTDIPPGVFNVVTSSDHMLGEQLTLSPKVDLISFTGSTAVGKRIMEKGSATMKRLFLELGGKSATIVLEDADFPTAVRSGMAICVHAGQGCAIQTRMLLPRSRYDEGVEILKNVLGAVPYGDPTDPRNLMGPLVSEKQRGRVEGYINRGVEQGATLALGGGRPAHLPTGWFLEPTLFTDVDNGMTIAQEEIFGPVLCVIAFDDDDDAIRIANASVYGLAGGVFSGSHDRAMTVARSIRTGVMGVNGGIPHGPDMPFGGYKHSGIGRQNGFAGFEQYVETKAVAWPKTPTRGQPA